MLESVYGPNDEPALHKSKLWLEGKGSAARISYTGRAPGLTVMAWTAGGRLELYVESSPGRLRETSERVWEAILDGDRTYSGRRLRPRLQSVSLVDPDTRDVLATATVGAGKIVRDQLFVPVVTGIVSAIVLAIALVRGASEEFLYGSVTALAVAILSACKLAWSLRSKELMWR